MVIHALWASVVFVKKNRERLERFHRFSVGGLAGLAYPLLLRHVYGYPRFETGF